MTVIQETRTQPRVTTWQIDPAHSEVGFSVKHLMISRVKGRFGGVKGTLELDELDPTRSSVKVEIDATTIDTGEAQRDAHLRSPDFFDVERHPTITFRSRRVERAGEGRYRVAGDLTMRGANREVVLEVIEEGLARDPWGRERAGFSATGTIDRRDFGLTWNQALETGGIVVGNDVRILLEVQFVKAAE